MFKGTMGKKGENLKGVRLPPTTCQNLSILTIMRHVSHDDGMCPKGAEVEK
jgi:hypothetical protein